MKLNQEPLLQLGDLTFVGFAPFTQLGRDAEAASLGLGQSVYRSPGGRIYTCSSDHCGNVAGHEPIGPRQNWRSIRGEVNESFQSPDYGQPIVLTADLGNGHGAFVGFWFNIAELICAPEHAPALAALAQSHPAAALELARFVTDTAIAYTISDPMHRLFDLEKSADGIARMQRLVTTLAPTRRS